MIKRQLLLTCLLLVSALCWAAPSYAQVNATLFDLSLEELMRIPITGSTQSEETLNTVPSAVTVFDRRQIHQMGVTTLAELANFAPGFQVQRSGDSSAYSMISSRGRRIAAASGEILLLVDGLRTENLRLSAVNMFLEMPLSNVQRVEFIRGPGAAVYGSNAMMGVINVVTVNGENVLQVDAGSNGNHRASLLASAQNDSGRIDFHLDHSASTGQDFIVPDSFTGEPVATQDPYRKTYLLAKASSGKFSGAARYIQQHFDEFYVIDFIDPNVNKNHKTYGDIALAYHGGVKKFTTSTEAVYVYSREDLSFRVSPPNAFAGISAPSSTAPLLGITDYGVERWSLNNHSRWEINSNSHLGFGVSYRTSEMTKQGSLSNFDVTALSRNDIPIASSEAIDIPVATYSLSKQRVLGIYAQWQNQLRESTQLTLGLRYDDYPNIDEMRLSPRLAWVEELNQNHRFKLLYGEAFRAPSIHEQSLINNPVVIGNPDLEAEVVATTEFIWLANYKSTLWSLGYFNSRFTDSIFQNVQAGSVRQYVNTEHDAISGLEFEVQHEFSEHLRLSATATRLTETDKRTYREASQLGSLLINYHRKRWSFNAGAFYRGQRATDVDFANSLDPYWQSYSKIQYQATPTLHVYFRASNLADKAIAYAAQGANIPEGIPSRGREWALGVEWQWH